MVATSHQDLLFMYVRDLNKAGSLQLDLMKPTDTQILHALK